MSLPGLRPSDLKYRGSEACFSCRLRKKLCRGWTADIALGLVPTPACHDCVKFNIYCCGRGEWLTSDESILEEVRNSATKPWIKDVKNRNISVSPLDLSRILMDCLTRRQPPIEKQMDGMANPSGGDDVLLPVRQIGSSLSSLLNSVTPVPTEALPSFSSSYHGAPMYIPLSDASPIVGYVPTPLAMHSDMFLYGDEAPSWSQALVGDCFQTNTYIMDESPQVGFDPSTAFTLTSPSRATAQMTAWPTTSVDFSPGDIYDYGTGWDGMKQ
ncbi:uncharacterized protein EI90DRAFT_3051106 [Cantharellus anzutake]|uniref:uncharacterized protein n=1 Tax=Cantharellus anzutake TaxID=1750568 RepID=UPI001907CF6C|nr:uncharacterized protein EI90DRAFT_3051106 [Cantharellus anzutake]KAF8334117.1 hypothetical protein EI90DRAFT_3051106 [Cantharellus anzutake]